LSLNVVSSWWKDEATKYAVQFEQHDDRYARTAEWLDVLNSLWQRDGEDITGKYYSLKQSVLQPKPMTQPRPTLYAGGESETAKDLIARTCDAYVMHGDPPERIRDKITDMAQRREKLNLPPMQYGIAAYSVVRKTDAEVKREIDRITDVKQSAAGYDNYRQWLAGTQLDRHVTLEDYSVSNRGLRAGLTGTPQQVIDRVAEFHTVGVNLLLLQCSPQYEEMERFACEVIQPTR